jgi:rod shape-determining protein MreC
MRNLLNFLARYNNLIIFLILEGIAFILLSSGNNYHRSRLVNSVRGITNGIDKRIYNTKSYLNLRVVNGSLAAENVALRNQIARLVRQDNSGFSSYTDSLNRQIYTHTSAEVIENSINRQKNFFTINKGDNQGIKPDMAVITSSGVAGVVVGCSGNFSVVMSLLNLDFKVSARIKSNGYFGSLSWDGHDYRHAILSEIPQHVIVSAGDTIETTGYSAIFPEGVIIGTVSDYEKFGGDFYRISVLLSTDFKKLYYVDVIGNKQKLEQLNLEKQFK